MKSYSKDINKLYETIGFEKIEKGKSYTTSKGVVVSVDDIYIDVTKDIPVCYSSYSVKNIDGKVVNETNTLDVVVGIIREK